MANPTAEHAGPAATQAPSPGVVRQGEHPKAPPVKRPEPVLFEDIDKVLLLRLFADEIDVSASRAKALAQGIATLKEGDALVASQNEPILVTPADGAPPAAPHQPPKPTPTPTPTAQHQPPAR